MPSLSSCSKAVHEKGKLVSDNHSKHQTSKKAKAKQGGLYSLFPSSIRKLGGLQISSAPALFFGYQGYGTDWATAQVSRDRQALKG